MENEAHVPEIPKKNFTIAIVLGVLTTVSFFPSGLLPILYPAIRLLPEDISQSILNKISTGWFPGNIYHVLFLVLAVLAAINPAKQISTYLTVALVVLCFLNIGGCAVMWQGLSEIGG
jgi:hypothetical protein